MRAALRRRAEPFVSGGLSIRYDPRQVSVARPARRAHVAGADPHVSQTAVCDTPSRAPSDEPRGVSYPVSDSLSCKRRVRGPVSWDTLTDSK